MMLPLSLSDAELGEEFVTIGTKNMVAVLVDQLERRNDGVLAFNKSILKIGKLQLQLVVGGKLNGGATDVGQLPAPVEPLAVFQSSVRVPNAVAGLIIGMTVEKLPIL
jgi:hypothetical protein